MSWTHEDRTKLLSNLKKIISLSIFDCENVVFDSKTMASAPLSLYNNPNYTSVQFTSFNSTSSSNGAQAAGKKKERTPEQIQQRKAKKEAKKANKEQKEEKKAKKEQRKLERQEKKQAKIQAKFAAQQQQAAHQNGMIDLVSDIAILQIENSGNGSTPAFQPLPLSHPIAPVVVTCVVCGHSYKGKYPIH